LPKKLDRNRGRAATGGDGACKKIIEMFEIYGKVKNSQRFP
jgi:hypothetical protein